MLTLRNTPPTAANWTTDGGYALALIVNGKCSRSFAFPVPPQEIEDSDTFSTFIQPTQEDNDFYVERVGVGTKEIAIGGSMGVVPTQSAVQQMFGRGADLGAPFGGSFNIARKLGLTNSDEKTGFYYFHDLYSLLAQYAAQRTDDDVQAQLHFYSFRDEEWYVVEPIAFTRSRNARSPMAYRYRLRLRVVGVTKRVRTPENKENWALGALRRYRMLTAAVHNTALLVSQVGAVPAAIGVPNVARSFSNAVNDLLGVGPALVDGVNYFASTVGLAPFMDADSVSRWWQDSVTNGEFWSKDKKYWSDLKRRLDFESGALAPTSRNIADRLVPAAQALATSGETGLHTADNEDAAYATYSLGMDVWRQSLVALGARPFAETDYSAGVSAQEQEDFFAARNGSAGLLDDVDVAIAGEFNRTNPANPTTATAAARVVQRYPRMVDETAGSSLDAFRRGALGTRDPATYGLLRTVTVEAGDTPQSLAVRVFGDWRRYREVIVINDLRAPYFSKSGAPHTVAPGGVVYVPADGVTATPLRTVSDYETSQHRLTSVTLQSFALGVDVQVRDGALVLTPQRDLALVAGVEAFTQNIGTRLRTLASALYTEPAFGIPADVGHKDKSGSATLWRGFLLSAIASDDRVERVESVETRTEGTVATYRVALRLRGLDNSLVTSGRLLQW